MRRRLPVVSILLASFALGGCWRQELVRHHHWHHPPAPVYVVPGP